MLATEISPEGDLNTKPQGERVTPPLAGKDAFRFETSTVTKRAYLEQVKTPRALLEELNDM